MIAGARTGRPRPVRSPRVRRLLFATVALAALLGQAPAASAAAGGSTARSPSSAGRPPGRVLIVTIPRLGWRDVVTQDLPNLKRFLSHAAIGDLSLRTIGPRTALGAAYATIGAGNRAGALELDAGRVLGPTERFEDGSAAASFLRRTGIDGTHAAALHLSITSIIGTNNALLYGAVPGAFGTALTQAGWHTAVIANADADVQGVPNPNAPTGEPRPTSGSSGSSEVTPTRNTADPLGGENRPAALAVMGQTGVVEKGDVTRALLTRDAASPFGIRLDSTQVLGTLDHVWTAKTVGLVELSDLERFDRYSSFATSHQDQLMRRRALQLGDVLLGQVLQRTTPDDLVIVMSPAAGRAGEEPTPFAIRGPGFDSGVLHSGTTRRDGYVTLPDIAPTVLDQLGVKAPPSMNGTKISVTGSGNTSRTRYSQFVAWNKVTKFRDGIAGPIGSWYQAFEVIGWVLAAIALTQYRRLRPAAGFLALSTIALPPLAFLSGYFRYDRLGRSGYTGLLFLATAALVGLAVLVGWRLAGADQRRRALFPPLLLVALNFVVLIGDVVVGGGRGQINTVFGYSPVVAGRFAGYGNTAFALLATAGLVLACGAWAAFAGPGSSPGRRRLLLGFGALLFLVMIVADGHPSLGSDVGGVLALVPTGAVVLLLLRGERLGLRWIAAIVLGTAVVLGTFAAIDLSRPADQKTHLGRLIESSTGKNGGSSLKTVLDRKLTANIDSVTQSSFSLIVPAGLLLLLLLAWRRTGLLGSLARVPGLRACMWGGLVVCILGDAANDSGITVPAMMFPILLGFFVYVLVALGEDDVPDLTRHAATYGPNSPDEPRAQAQAQQAVAGLAGDGSAAGRPEPVAP
ncbi:MAG: hypothetical protein JWN46_1715 [Acidimicrobiales bacterium]|nr:hypothetical protein [Acidimicrobiales bacterium]